MNMELKEAYKRIEETQEEWENRLHELNGICLYNVNNAQTVEILRIEIEGTTVKIVHYATNGMTSVDYVDKATDFNPDAIAVWDTIKNIIYGYDDNGKRIVYAKNTSLVPITEEVFESMCSFINIQGKKVDNFLDEYEERVKDFKRNLNSGKVSHFIF